MAASVVASNFGGICVWFRVMVFPYWCAQSGIVLMILAILLAGIGTIGSLHDNPESQTLQHNNFGNLAEKAGGRLLKLFLILSILSYLFAGA